MNKVIIVHGWGGSSKDTWIPWLVKELKRRNFEVIALDMPDTENPKISDWINFLRTNIAPDEKTYFIGHSIGCQAIMRYLERLNTQIGGILFVAGWFNLDNLETEEDKEIAKQWIETPIKLERIKKNVRKISVLISEDEPYGFVKENEKIFKEKLGAQVFIEKGSKHFTDERMPIILNKFLELSK